MFYKRIIDNLVDATTCDSDERLVEAQVVSTGLNGGELLVDQSTGWTAISTPERNADTLIHLAALKAGNWIVVCGPHPHSTDDSESLRLPLVSRARDRRKRYQIRTTTEIRCGQRPIRSVAGSRSAARNGHGSQHAAYVIPSVAFQQSSASRIVPKRRRRPLQRSDSRPRRQIGRGAFSEPNNQPGAVSNERKQIGSQRSARVGRRKFRRGNRRQPSQNRQSPPRRRTMSLRNRMNKAVS